MTQHSLSPNLERDRSRDGTRRVEQAWASWYRLPVWKSIRRHRLAEEPQCRECAIEGRTVHELRADQREKLHEETGGAGPGAELSLFLCFPVFPSMN